MLVFRLFIGMDKEEIIRFVKKIGIYDIFIFFYEDCCIVFVLKYLKIKLKFE